MSDTRSSVVSPPARERRPNPIQLVVIAASTGGPEALAKVFAGIPRTFQVPIIVVQHMPPVFTTQLAERLASISGLSVREGTTEIDLRPGTVVVAPGDHHIVVRRRGAIHLVAAPDRGPHENSCRPAADVTLRTAAAAAPGAVLAAILTGIGRDGCAGSRAIVQSGGRVIAQDQATSVVWGMPGAVVTERLADRVLPLTDIASGIVGAVTRFNRGAST